MLWSNETLSFFCANPTKSNATLPEITLMSSESPAKSLDEVVRGFFQLMPGEEESLLATARAGLDAEEMLRKHSGRFFFGWRSALAEAARKGSAKDVWALIVLGVDINADDNSALREAICGGQLHVVELLLAAGADPNAGTFAPIVCAAFHGHLEIAKVLLDRGADIGARQGAAIRAAQNGGHSGMVDLLIERGADRESMHSEDEMVHFRTRFPRSDHHSQSTPRPRQQSSPRFVSSATASSGPLFEEVD